MLSADGLKVGVAVGQREEFPMRRDAGSIPTGPSEQYLRLLKGEISAKDYAKSVEKRVDKQRDPDRRDDGQSGAQPKRA